MDPTLGINRDLLVPCDVGDDELRDRETPVGDGVEHGAGRGHVEADVVLGTVGMPVGERPSHLRHTQAGEQVRGMFDDVGQVAERPHPHPAHRPGSPFAHRAYGIDHPGGLTPDSVGDEPVNAVVAGIAHRTSLNDRNLGASKRVEQDAGEPGPGHVQRSGV